jgi:hypothetical protein
MTPAEYEWQDEQMQEMADEVRAEAAKTGRDVREILEAMRDEGYIECSDDALERCAVMAQNHRASHDHAAEQ